MNFNHTQTPPELAAINQTLSDCLAQAEVDESHLTIFIDQRAKLVDKLLNSLNESQRQQFAAQEVKINQRLIELISDLRSTAKKALSNVAKSSRAIKQYQQV